MRSRSSGGRSSPFSACLFLASEGGCLRRSGDRDRDGGGRLRGIDGTVEYEVSGGGVGTRTADWSRTSAIFRSVCCIGDKPRPTKDMTMSPTDAVQTSYGGKERTIYMEANGEEKRWPTFRQRQERSLEAWHQARLRMSFGASQVDSEYLRRSSISRRWLLGTRGS